MTTEQSAKAFGWRLFGLGVMTLGALCLIFGNFDPGLPVPKDFPERTVLAYAAGAFMLVRWRSRRVAQDRGLGRGRAGRLLHAGRCSPDERPCRACALCRVRNL